MSNSRYRTKGAVASRFVHVFTMVNLALSLAILVAWPNYSDVLADPMSVIAGTGTAIRPSSFEYPFILFWVLPLVGVGATYVAKAIELDAVAQFFALFPTMLAISSLTWLYFYADYW